MRTLPLRGLHFFIESYCNHLSTNDMIMAGNHMNFRIPDLFFLFQRR